MTLSGALQMEAASVSVSHMSPAFQSRDCHMMLAMVAGCLFTCHVHCMQHADTTMLCNAVVSITSV